MRQMTVLRVFIGCADWYPPNQKRYRDVGGRHWMIERQQCAPTAHGRPCRPYCCSCWIHSNHVTHDCFMTSRQVKRAIGARISAFINSMRAPRDLPRRRRVEIIPYLLIRLIVCAMLPAGISSFWVTYMRLITGVSFRWAQHAPLEMPH